MKIKTNRITYRIPTGTSKSILPFFFFLFFQIQNVIMSSDLGRWFNLGNPGLQRPGPTQTDRVTVRRSVLLYGGNRLF